MNIGQKVTILFSCGRPFNFSSEKPKFLRCYVTKRFSDGWQLYDPVRDWSWGLKDGYSGARVHIF